MSMQWKWNFLSFQGSRSVAPTILIVLSCLIMSAPPAQGASYYIDCAGGSDSNNGTSTSTPWLHHPYMRGWTGSYSHTAGDKFYFKGGVSCPNSYFPMTIAAGGSTGAGADYYGPDPTFSWFTGSSWSRPIWDFQGTAISGNNVAVYGNNADYVTWDNFELINYYYTGGSITFGSSVMFNYHGHGYNGITFDHMYIHRWSHGTIQTGGDLAYWILGNSGNNPTTTIIRNSIIGCPVGDGACDGRSFNAIYGGWGTVQNTVFHDMVNGIAGFNYVFSGNLLYNIQDSLDSQNHCNGWEGWTEAGSSVYVFNNVFHDTASGCYAIGIWGNDNSESANGTNYTFNNVFYNIASPHGGIESDGPTGSESEYIWNNTIFGSTSGNDACIHLAQNQSQANALKTAVIANNFCISNLSSPFTIALTVANLTTTPNSIMTHANATTAGYTPSQAIVGLPTSPSCNGVANCPVGAGSNFTSATPGCGSVGLNGLCSDTSYAVTIANGNVAQVGRTAVARPASGAWDSGAYQSGSSGGALSACDINKDGFTNVADVQQEINMALGKTTCTNPSGTCNVISVQKVINAALGGTCVAP